MRKLLLRFFLLCFGICCMTILQAQENFASPRPIGLLNGNYDCGLHYTNSDNTCGYAHDIGSPSNDVVYSFVLTSVSTVTMTTCAGTSYDSWMRLYDAGLFEIAYNDDDCGLQSTITMALAPGIYYIVVEGWGSYCGNYMLDVFIPDTDAPVPQVGALVNLSDPCSVTPVVPTAIDLCNGAVINGVPNVSIPVVTSTIITWTYTDLAGNVATQTQNVTINDITAPYPDLSGFTINIIGAGGWTDESTWYMEDASSTVVASGGPYGYSGVGVLIQSIAGIPSLNGPYTFHGETQGTIGDNVFSFNVVCNSVVVSSGTFTPMQNLAFGGILGNNLPPVTAQCTVNSLVAPSATDNCGGPVTITNNAVLPITAQGTTVVTWTYSDVNLNTSTQTQNVVIDDITAPVADLPVLADVTAECQVTVLVAPTATDNCGGLVTVTNNAVLPIIGQGTTVVTWTYQDAEGNTSTQTQNVVIDDITAPVAVVPVLADVTAECQVLSLIAPTATDNCGGLVTVTNDAVLPIIGQGTTVVTWTYQDAEGNTSTQTQNVVIDDITAPLSDTPAGSSFTLTSVDVPNGIADFATTSVDLLVAGLPSQLNSGQLSSVCIVISHTYDSDLIMSLLSPEGTTFLLSSSNGSNGQNYTGTCFSMSAATPITAGAAPFSGSFIPQGAGGFDAFNNENPNGLWQLLVYDQFGGDAGSVNSFVMNFDFAGGLDDVTAECEVLALVAPTATDNCGGLVTVTNDAVFPINAQGTTVVTWTYDDGNGNTSSETQNVVIDDNTAPVADVPVLADVTAECEVLALTAPTATDNCGGLVTVTNNAVFPITAQGTTVVTWTYDDGRGNTSTQTQNIVIDDITNPTITCPADLTINSEDLTCEGVLAETIVYDIPFAQLIGMSSGNWCGISPNEALTCGGNLGFTWNSVATTQPDEVLVEFYQGYNDNGPVPMTLNGIPDSNYSGLSILCASNLYSLHLNPANLILGNTNTVMISSPGCLLFGENPNPVWAAGSYIRVTEIYAVVDMGTPVVSDNCAVLSVTNNAAVSYTVGTHTIQWTVTDNGGNTATCNQQLTVVDATAPVADLLVLADVTAECQVTVLVAPTATDNCGGLVTVTNNAVLPIIGQGTTVVTWTYQDAEGNTSTQTQNVVIDDITAPVAVVPVLADVTAECQVLSLIAPTATDNCGGLVTVTNDAVLPITAQGTTVVTWTYQDAEGNNSTQTQNVVIDDITAPVADLPVLSDVTSECQVSMLTNPTATDNCGLVTVTNNAVLPITSQGTTVVTWTYDDGNGNTSTQTQDVVIDDNTNATITCPTDLTVDADAMSCEFLIFETIVYDIPFSQLVGATALGPNCNGTVDAFVCGGNYGLTWNSTETITPVSIDVEFYQTWNSNAGTIPLTLNATPDNNYNGPNQTCVNNLVNLSLNPANYNIGGLNIITINTPSCFVLDQNPNPTWAPQSYARVSVKIPVFDLGTPVVADNCAVLSVTNNAADSYTLGTHTIQWTVTDNGGNTATCNQQLTVVDATAPVADLLVLADVTAECQILSLVAPTATDNCGGLVTVTNDAVLPITSQGSYLVTWTYDDGNGNTSTQTQNVVINDITAPVPNLVSLPDLTDACSIALLTAPTATDNCGGLVTVTRDAVLPIMGTSTITWSYDDGRGNISTQTQEVIINDNVAPVPDLPVLTDITAECEVTMLVAPTATDNCGGLVTVTHDAILPINAQGTTVVTWTFADANMNITTQTQNVVITDITAPVADIPVLADVTAECEIWGLMNPTATDNCGGLIMVTNDAIYPINTQGTTVVTWTYDDGNGNSSTQTQNVVIDDISGPTPDMFMLDVITSQCEVNTLATPSATDNCGGPVTVTHNAVLPISTQGTTVVTWTYEDQYGNTSTQTQDVVIDDTQAPVPDISGFQIQIIADNNVSDDFSWNLVDASSTVVASGGPYTNLHNGQVLQMINNLNAENGPYTFNGWGLGVYNDNDWSFEIYCNSSLVASESYSNSETASYSGITGCDSYLNILTDDCSITSLTAPTATDDCSSTVTVSHDAVLPITGTSIITWSFDDGNGNISTQTQEVIINDNVAPVLDLPVLADITSECEVSSFVYPTATDACGGPVTVTHDAILPITAQGTTVVTWTYADANMNSVTQTQNVVLTDLTAPVADMPVLADVVAECEVTSLIAPTVTDNCGGIVTVTSDAVLPYIGQGTTVITWTYEDVNGNASTQTQNIVIEDISGPVADVPVLADVTAECIVTVLVNPTATDNCGGPVAVTNDAILPITAQGTTIVSWTYEDAEGNTTTQTQNVVLNDITFPVADALSLVDLTADCEITSWVEPTATDNCVGTITGVADVTLPVQGTTTITWTFEDANGNITTQTQQVIINDAIAPVLDVTDLTDVTGDCEVVALTEPTATDNCLGTIIGVSDAVLPITAQGTTVVTWTFTDGNGNFVTQTQNVVLEDLIAPVADVADLGEVVECFELAVLTEPTATDNCGGTVTVTHNATLPITTSTTITWTYEDVNGNTSTQTQSIVINTVDVSVTDASPVLTANATGATYQWVDCDNANAPIAGETSQSFTATENGNYAVEVTQNGCTDLSDCISVTNVGIEAEISVFEVEVYPNPTTSVLFVQLTNDGETTWKLTNVTGQVVLEGVNYEDIFQLDLSEYAPGVYMLNIQQNDNVINKRVVRK